MRKSELYEDILMRFVDREFVKQPHTNRGDESSNIDNEKEFRQQIESEFEPSYELMIDPSLLASEPKSSQLQDSRILHDEGIRLSVPQSLTDALTDLDKYNICKQNVISEFAGQAQQTSREQILATINENSIRKFHIIRQIWRLVGNLILHGKEHLTQTNWMITNMSSRRFQTNLPILSLHLNYSL